MALHAMRAELGTSAARRPPADGDGVRALWQPDPRPLAAVRGMQADVMMFQNPPTVPCPYCGDPEGLHASQLVCMARLRRIVDEQAAQLAQIKPPGGPAPLTAAQRFRFILHSLNNVMAARSGLGVGTVDAQLVQAEQYLRRAAEMMDAGEK